MPFAAKGALDQTEIMKCSNGEMRKAKEWNIDKRQTFHQYIIATSRNFHKTDSTQNSKGEDIEVATPRTVYVGSENKNFYNKLWNNSFQEFNPNVTTLNYKAYYSLPNVLSNIGYDIYLVTAPALAADTAATVELRRPTKFSCKMYGPGLSSSGEKLQGADGKTKNFETRPDSIDYFLVAENYKFKKCTVGIDDKDLQYDLMINTTPTNNDMLIDVDDPDKKIYTRVLRVNAILVVPHGSLELVDELPTAIGNSKLPTDVQGTPGLLMYPHRAYDDAAGAFKADVGAYKVWYMQR
jgi:hypothetical protein